MDLLSHFFPIGWRMLLINPICNKKMLQVVIKEINVSGVHLLLEMVSELLLHIVFESGIIKKVATLHCVLISFELTTTPMEVGTWH